MLRISLALAAALLLAPATHAQFGLFGGGGGDDTSVGEAVQESFRSGFLPAAQALQGRVRTGRTDGPSYTRVNRSHLGWALGTAPPVTTFPHPDDASLQVQMPMMQGHGTTGRVWTDHYSDGSERHFYGFGAETSKPWRRYRYQYEIKKGAHSVWGGDTAWLESW
jgi:hypothetical protein